MAPAVKAIVTCPLPGDPESEVGAAGTDTVGKLKVLDTDAAGAYRPTCPCEATSVQASLEIVDRVTVTVVTPEA